MSLRRAGDGFHCETQLCIDAVWVVGCWCCSLVEESRYFNHLTENVVDGRVALWYAVMWSCAIR